MIKAQNLRKTFGEKVAVDNLSFEVEKGEGSTHAGFHVTWKIKCDHPKRLKYLETTFFKLFQNGVLIPL